MTWVFLCFVLVVLSMSASSALALKILGISTVPSPSHHIWFTELMNGLARKGHQIYALGMEPTKFDLDEVMDNQTKSFVLEGVMDYVKNHETFSPLKWSQMKPIQLGWTLYQEAYDLCEIQIMTEGAKQVLELVKNTKIDVIVADLTHNSCLNGLWEVAQGNPPVVGFTPFGQAMSVKRFVGGNDWPAIKPYPYYAHVAPFTLWEKTLNLIYYELDNIIHRYYYMPIQQKLTEEFIGKKMSKSHDGVRSQISAMLINSYAALEPAIFQPANVIAVGGLHVKDPKPLPQDIKEFLDGAEHGVVVISLGTNIKTEILGPDRLNAIVTALGKLKQRVLWKFDLDHLANKPQNVMIKKWIPQGGILAYPKVRVIWTHGGLLSTQEAVWRGVPLIGMPFYMDQKSNVDLLVKKGVALRLDFEFLTTEMISETIDRILTNPSFDRRMKQLSLEYRDRPMSPMDLAIWHVEYASRHPRGPLASPGRDLSSVQLNLLDVYAVLAFAVVLIVWILRLFLRALFNLLFRSGQKTKIA